jgi:hypothetical protein
MVHQLAREHPCWGYGRIQQGRQAWSREEPAEASKQHPVSGLPGGLANLALESAELMAEGEHLGAELGV